MSGRKNFSRMKFPIILLSRLFALAPNFFCGISYRISFFMSGPIGQLMRYVINKSGFGSVGDACYFGAYTVFKNQKKIFLGDRCSIHEFCYFDGAGEILIGNDVSFAHGCSVISFDHGWSDISTPIKYNPIKNGRIIIENDVWVGAGVKILSGSYIESRVIVASGAVVKGRLESGWIYGGIPARKLKSLSC